MDGKIAILVVKTAERVVHDNFSDMILGPGAHRPFSPTDSWTLITFVTSFMLGYAFPKELSFALTVILGLDIVFHYFSSKQPESVSGEHMIMTSVSSALGYIFGIYLRTGWFV
jgi:hypothetical protein